jgi:protocatechuate 3,4-dioxygenase beta subunit
MMPRRLAVAALVCLSSAPILAGQLPAPARPPAPPQVGQARDDNRQPTKGTGALVGRVVDLASGQPVDGARVSISGPNMFDVPGTVSDDDGRFAFANLPAGQFTLRASKSGYLSAAYGQKSAASGSSGTPIDLADGQEMKDLVLSLPRGGVITGIVFDEKNRPSVGTPVRVMRWSMQSGERTLSQSNSATTDDRGIYRVYGLPPGDYIVSAVPRNQIGEISIDQAMLIEEAMRARELAISTTSGGGSIGGEYRINVEPPHLEATTGYAPVYYPGTSQPSAAQTLRLGVSEERGGVDFALSRVSLAKVDGMVLMTGGMTTSGVTVRLIDLDDGATGLNRPSTRTGRDGKFTFNAVPPGRYRAVAVGALRTAQTNPRVVQPDGSIVVNSSVQSRGQAWAATEVVVNGSNITNVTLALQDGMTIAGRVSFSGTAPRPSPSARLRIALAPFGSQTTALGVSSSTVNVDADGRFTFVGVVPGQYRIRSVSGASGYSLASAVLAGRDTLDYFIDVQPGQNINGLEVELADKSSSLGGAIQDVAGKPTSDYTVILFAADRSYWRASARRIRATRPSTTGRFSFSGLPAGEYRLAAVTDVESGQWFDPAFLEQLQAASIAVTLVDGQARTQDLRVASR